ncbi:MAG: sensor histidine kinase [Bacteroidia bacterium]
MKALKQTAWIHLILWGLYVLSEFLANMMHYRPWQREQLVRDILIYLPVIMAASYTISLWLVPRYLQTTQKLKFWLGVTAVLALLYLGRIYWIAALSYLERGEWTIYPAPKVLKNVIRDYAVVGFAVCLQIITDWQRQAKLNQQLKNSQSELALKLLKAQLHPHFLFNTLNNLYGLALRKSDEAADGILRLSALLDYLLYAAEKDYVSLQQEVELLDNYIALEKLRYGDELVVDWQIEEPLDSLRLAPLLLLPLAENAFKHGHKGLDGRLHLAFELKIEDNSLRLSFGNSFQTSLAKSVDQGGIGLQNLRQRLDLLYPASHKLQIEAREDWFEARLWISLT